MCIVIDADTLSCVFKSDNKMHYEFIPVYDWIIRGKGKMVVGGSKYDEELREVKSLTRLFLELVKAGKIRSADSHRVDAEELELRRIVQHRDFDDQHIIAIVIISGANLICTGERRAIPFYTDKLFYPKGRVPKIYKSLDNKNLLNKKYCGKCKITCTKPNKETSSKLESTKENTKKRGR
jgi:hypothetical protein